MSEAEDIPAELGEVPPELQSDASRDAKRKGRRYTPSPAAPPGNERSINELRLEQQERDVARRAEVQDSVDLVVAAIEDAPNDPVCRRAIYDAVVKALKA